MLRPVRMMRMSTVVLDHDQRAVLRELGKLGAVELTRTAASENTAPLPPADVSAELSRYDRLLSRGHELHRLLEIPFYIKTSSTGAMTLVKAEAKQHRLEQRAAELVERREQLRQQLTELETISGQMIAYSGLRLPLDKIGRLNFLHCVTGSLPVGAEERLDVSEPAVLVPLAIRQGRQPVIALTTRQAWNALESALHRAGFEPTVLPTEEHATPEAVLENAQREQVQTTTDLERVCAEIRMLAREAGETLAEIEPWATVERRLLEAQRLFPRTETAVLIRGWIPASSVAAVKARLLERSGGRCVTETTNPEDESGERIPVLLSHSRLLRPFEMLVAAYGLPRYGELAPTPFVAVSYVLMFGMMFGDVGHGGLIALAGLIGLLAGSRTRWRDVGVLLLFNGLSSAVFGLIYGSIFGIPWLKEYALWHDPLEGDPMTLMVVAVGLGALLMSVGLVLNIVNHLQRGEWFEGVFDKFGVTGVVFYWGALLLLAKSTALQASGWFSWVAVFFLGVPLVCWTLKEPLARMARPEATCGGESGGAITAVVESIVGAFEAVLLYLSNTISFVRLAAYAMSHAALLMAAFVLAAEVERLAVCGAALSLVVIVLGNIIVLVLEGIVAAVQALRLEYYEFFGKFFSGDGQPFKPFLLATHGGWR